MTKPDHNDKARAARRLLIRQGYELGLSLSELAAAFGVSKEAIRGTLSRQGISRRRVGRRPGPRRVLITTR